MAQTKIFTLAERPDLQEELHAIQSTAWPEFLLHEAIANRYWHHLFIKWPQFQFGLLDAEENQIVAAGNSIPLYWEDDVRQLPDAGWDWALQTGMTQAHGLDERNVQCALSIAILPQYRGAGLSHKMIEAMKQIGRDQGFRQLIAPVRPNLKKLYPLTPMKNYVQWTDEVDLPFDAWLRTHIRSGAKLVKVCSRSMMVSGSIEDWEQWTGLHLPESGLYVVDGALMPVKIMVDKKSGVYAEPNVWVVYDLA